MYQTSLFFKIKDAANKEKHHILELFFKSWVDDTCNNEVAYDLHSVEDAPANSLSWQEIYRIDFEHAEDAVALRLKGIPAEFSNYIEIVT